MFIQMYVSKFITENNNLQVNTQYLKNKIVIHCDKPIRFLKIIETSI